MKFKSIAWSFAGHMIIAVFLLLVTVGFSYANSAASGIYTEADGSVNGKHRFEHVRIHPGDNIAGVEQRYVELLADRIRENTGASVSVGSEEGPSPALVIYIGLVDSHNRLRSLIDSHRHIKPPDRHLDPGPEGFALHSVQLAGGDLGLLAAGVEQRGVLYAAGEILRQLSYDGHAVYAPEKLNIRTSPAFPLRGTQVYQGHPNVDLPGISPWTAAEAEREILDFALAGANTFQVQHGGNTAYPTVDFLKKYGLKSLYQFSPTAGSGPVEWRASESIGRESHLCPSIPEARQALINQYSERIRNWPAYDYIRIHAGDGGGCECLECAPFGKVYIHLCEIIARIVHEHNPDAKIIVNNQKLDKASDEAIFAYLQEEPREWFYAFEFGPGSSGTMWTPGRRQTHWTHLFEYPAFGGMDLFHRETIRQMPPRHHLILFTNITHWTYSQFSLQGHEVQLNRLDELPPEWDYWPYARRPDPALQQIYHRATFHARPRDYYHIFRETLRYTIGDVNHSDGQHDHFNNWMWQRLMWSPNTSLEDVVDEYARFWFGPEAAPAMAGALFQLERNLQPDVATNEGILHYYNLVTEAGLVMPPWRMKQNYLWRQHMQKAALDLYTQLHVRRQRELVARIEGLIARALTDGGHQEAIARSLSWLDDGLETAPMARLKDEARHWGDESAALFNVRSEGLYNLDQDFVGLAWYRRYLERAAGERDPVQRDWLLNLIAHYEDPGEGGFYDNAGVADQSPNIEFGWPFSGANFSGNRPSQRVHAFTMEHDPGVTIRYENLDPDARYRIRFAFVRREYMPRYAGRHPQTSQSIYADGVLLARDLELPVNESEIYEFDIPAELTADGELKVWLRKQDGIGEWGEPETSVWRNTGGWGTIVSDVWLIRK